MGEIVAFANSHPYHASIIVALLVAILVYEIRLKGQGLIQVSTQMAVQLINKGAMIIDVRPAEAFAGGHIINARNIPLADIRNDPAGIKKKESKVLLTVCDSGQSAKLAADVLRKAGYASSFSLQGGLAAWRTDNLPLVK